MARLLLLWLLLTAAVAGAQPQKLIVVLRVDDIMSRNLTILPRSISAFEQAAQSRGAKVTWVTIPHRLIESANQDGMLKRELIASTGRGHEIAMHGYTHICQRCSQSSHEMFCTTHNLPFTYAQQEKLVYDGRQILADSLGVQALTFVPPGHHADSTTYRVLVDQGFRWISTSGPAKVSVAGGLFNLPPHREYTWQMVPASYQARLHQALQDVRSLGRADGYFCLLFHDPFTRPGYENGLVVRWVGEVLDSLRAEYGSDLVFMTLAEAAQHFAGRLTAVTQHNAAPLAGALVQNYPNPFNAATLIEFRLAQAAPVQMTVFNANGQAVAQLLDGRLPQGTHRVRWQAAAAASGVYYLRLQAGASNTTCKLLLLR
ncbi:MAG: DUF2334 domain-containing protein [candidate division KSB1 bacterium]|nr:DUF2334 domain-containing protein [candidate division KSB1 bacterium]MDZ7276350.1 DUF2334 domain-containing protein [candidate division KSB1 bacterium]MDZ7287698.1 DUF2334 domain-containing protein [candidate division KSB1 bacterium]MDZ7299962.1 DUF2334 domain-containing protein [candidate division KSB1 bacterium]MDZ7305709.1 DUF2334 domain-containing protein [candidate division KSB1 bacterium]